MDVIVTFFESFVQPLRDAWFSGGWAALLAAVLASPVLMVLIRIFFAYLSGRSAAKKARRRKLHEEEDKTKARMGELFEIISKEIPRHEDY